MKFCPHCAQPVVRKIPDGDHLARFDLIDIGFDADHAVRIVPQQIGLHQRMRHLRRDIIGCASRVKYRLTKVG